MKKLLRSLWYALFSVRPSVFLKTSLLKLLPESYLQKKREAFFTGDQSFVARILRESMNEEFYNAPSSEMMKMNRAVFWGGDAGRNWHLLVDDRISKENGIEEYMRFRRPLIKQIQSLKTMRPDLQCICEVGTGNGVFLEILHKEIKGVKNFIGVDLNREQIEANRIEFTGKALDFRNEDILEFFESVEFDELILVSCGTFEYFTEKELEELFTRATSTHRAVAIALCEPVNIDLESTISSVPRGNIAFSHNYPAILKKCGFSIEKFELLPIDPTGENYNNVVLTSYCERRTMGVAY